MNHTFETCFVFGMMFEVGSFFDPTDDEVVQGLCGTTTQKRKTGYVNDPDDAGGETKFGIAKNANPSVNIKTLTLHDAKQIYRKKYWSNVSLDKLPSPLNLVTFDAVINCGASRGIKFLQRAIGVKQTGLLDRATLTSIKRLEVNQLDDVAIRCVDERDAFYDRLIAKKPTNAKYRRGWFRRTQVLRTYIDRV